MRDLRVVIAVSLATVACCMSTLAEDLRVRMYSAAPPTEIEIIPLQATLRACAACKARSIDSAIKVVATAHLVHYGEASAAAIWIAGAYRLRANGATSILLKAPLEVRSDTGKLRIVARMPIEEYVAMAVGGEAGGIRSPEALKAIAVAIRTYAVKFRGRHAVEGFDLCDSTHCQVLRTGEVNPQWRAAAEDTEGELLWYNGELALAYHHASCGGMLEDGGIMVGHSVPYLHAHADPVCSTGVSDWDAQIGKAELREALVRAGFHLGASDGIAVTDRDRSGRARRLVVDGAPVDATSFRMAVGRGLGWNKVRSELYDVSDQGTSVIFHGRGRGHGVGLCQTGAQLRADQGANYRDILAFYYPGTKVGVTAQGLPWIRMAGERIELQTTNEQDKKLITTGEQILREVERRTGWKLERKPQLRVFPTVTAFRDSTGEPGWIAASTEGGVIRLQPLPVLRAKGTLESTLGHELLHMLIEEKARVGTPLWFREGLVLWLAGGERSKTRDDGLSTLQLERHFQDPTSEVEVKNAYTEAMARVALLVKKHGEALVLRWVKEGLPKNIEASQSENKRSLGSD